MVIDKSYFLNRLASGEDMDTIGQEMAAAMNAAMTEYNARMEAETKAKAEKAALAEKEAAKRELIEEIVEIIQELAILEGMDPDEMQVTDEDMDQMVAAFTEMFGAMRELKKMVAKLDSVTPNKSSKIAVLNDDQILADFIKMFN